MFRAQIQIFSIHVGININHRKISVWSVNGQVNHGEQRLKKHGKNNVAQDEDTLKLIILNEENLTLPLLDW